MSANVRYRRWQLFVSGDWQTGSYVHEFNRQFRFRRGLADDAVPAAAYEGSSTAASWLNFTNLFVEKADFFKVRTIRLDYTFLPRIQAVKSLNVAFSVYNPLSFTAAKEDPEAVLSSARSQGAVAAGGINYASFSAPRQWILSLTATF